MRLPLLAILTFFVLAASAHASLEDRLKKVFSFLRQERAHLKTVLGQLRAKLDRRLIEAFPKMRTLIEKSHKDIDHCYDQAIGTGNSSRINIFEAKLKDVVVKFFKTHGQMFKGLSRSEIRKRVHILLGNIKQLAGFLLECIANRAAGRNDTKLGLTQLAFYSRDEFENKILNKRLNTSIHLRASGPSQDECSRAQLPSEPAILPDSFSWLDQKRVSPVYHQFECGACFVFATTSALESQYMIRSKSSKAPHYSVQATLNCMGDDPCGGGGLEEPMEFYVQHGVTEDHHAQYQNKALPCRRDYPIALKATRSCFHVLLTEEEMQRLVMRNGPAAVAIDARSKRMPYLKRQPLTFHCGKDVDHAVLLVGWTKEHWIIKNSWGPSWGIDGYLHLPRGQNKCGVQTMIGIPIVRQL